MSAATGLDASSDEGIRTTLTHLAAAHPFMAYPSIILLVLLTLTLLYTRLLPKPFPDIPYDPKTATSVLGDFPKLFDRIRNSDLRSYLGNIGSDYRSPVAQVLAPFGRRPTLVVTDFRTTQDILLRRSKEFDRPKSMVDALGGVIPNHHIAMFTADPQFRKNRELVKDLMTPHFLHTVNAPEIWQNAVQFVDLWRRKAAVAGGRPFDAMEDITRLTFDIILNVALGKGEGREGLIEVYLERIREEYGASGKPVMSEKGDVDAPFPFPKPPHDETLEAQTRMNTAITQTMVLPPKLFHAVNNRRKHMREAYNSKERLLRRQVALATKRMEAGEPLESALDYMIKREMGAAAKEQRKPVFDSPAMFDELYGYLGAGHDTTATTIQWGLKHLALHPEAQQKARQDLRAVFADAHAQNRPPFVTEIIKTQTPYLDAVIEEILRLSGPVGATGRETTTDTTLLGRRVPKGTFLFLCLWGASITGPSVGPHEGVGDDKLPPMVTKRDSWDGMEPEKFLPERWLEQDDDGGWVFDAQAGPMLSFSLGIRGCFGRRLAYLTLKMLFTMVLWNFELQVVPQELDTWDAIQILTRKPVQCYVRLAEAK